MRARALVKGQAPLHAPIAMQLVPDHWRHHFAPCFIFGFVAAILLGTPRTISYCGLCLALGIVKMELDGLPESDKAIPVWFSDQEAMTFNHCLPLLSLEMDCQLNDFAYLVKTAYNRHIPPPINELHSHWRAWDEEISPQFRFHLLVTYCNLGT
jgi:hypothetical protein